MSATAYQAFPAWMTHPGYRPGQVGPLVKDQSGFTYHAGGKPVQMPPVQVMTEDDEAYYAAKGYIRQGKMDPDAYAKAHAIDPAAFNFKPDEYPKWVELPASFNRPGEQVCVNTEDEELGLLEGVLPVGAKLSVPAAPYVLPPAPDTKDAEIAALKGAMTDMQANMAETLAAMQKQFQEMLEAQAPRRGKRAEQDQAAA